jgi:pimeloyl-ACP methyl ester carboxylesterase
MTPNFGPFRMSVAIAEELAKLGIVTLRLDQSGKGESPLRSRLTPAEAALLDFDDAFAHLQGLGVERVLLIGLCSGAFDALRIAQHRQQVCGLVLLDGYVEPTLLWHVYHHGKRLRRLLARGPIGIVRRLAGGSDYVSQEPLETILTDNRDLRLLAQRPAYEKFLGRGGSLLSIYSGGFGPYNHQGQLSRYLGSAAANGCLTEVFFKEADHVYTLIAHRSRLIEQIRSWATTTFVNPEVADAARSRKKSNCYNS